MTRAERFMSKLRIDWFTILLASIGALGTALVLLREATYGVGLGVDSVTYISTARSLSEGDGFTAWYGGPYGGAAPLFPLAAASLGIFGIDAVPASGYLNAAAFGLTIFALTMWLRCRVRSRLLVIWASCACALAVSLASLSAMALTSPLFILFVVLSLFALDRFLDTGNRSLLLIAAACAAMACLTRYIGLTVLMSALPILLLQRSAAFPTRAMNVAIYSIVALIPIGAWMLRNLLVLGSLTGRVFPTEFELLESAHKATDEIALWTFGQTGFDYLHTYSQRFSSAFFDGYPILGDILFKIAVLLTLVIVAGYLLIRMHRRGQSQDWLAFAVPATFIVVYAAFLAVSLPLTDIMLPPRYLAPMYVPMLASAVLALDQFHRWTRGRRTIGTLPLLWKWPLPRPIGQTSLYALALAAALALWIPQHVSANQDDIRQWNEQGMGYASKKWAESDILRYRKAHSIEGPIWTTEPLAMYLWIDAPTYELPRDLAGSEHLRNVGDMRLLWFYGHRDVPWRPRYSLGEILNTLPELELEAILEDGIILKSGENSDGNMGISAEEIIDQMVQDTPPVIRATFDLHMSDDNTLIYLKDECTHDDLEARFFLHVTPTNRADLLPERRGHGFDNLDFGFYERGFLGNRRCVATRRLPDYDIASIRTGQFADDGQLWRNSFRPGLDKSIFDIPTGNPTVRSKFDIYLDEASLIYVEELCSPTDVVDRFFLHVVPDDQADLPSDRRRHGFDNLDFDFYEYGVLEDGRCVAIRELPNYNITTITTGQFSDAGRIWSVELAPDHE